MMKKIGNNPGMTFFCWTVSFKIIFNRKQKQVTVTESLEQNKKIAYVLNATSNIKLQVWQLDGPTRGQIPCCSREPSYSRR